MIRIRSEADRIGSDSESDRIRTPLLHKPKSSIEKKEDYVDEGNIIPKTQSNATTLETTGAVLFQVILVRVIGQHESRQLPTQRLTQGRGYPW